MKHSYCYGSSRTVMIIIPTRAIAKRHTHVDMCFAHCPCKCCISRTTFQTRDPSQQGSVMLLQKPCPAKYFEIRFSFYYT